MFCQVDNSSLTGETEPQPRGVEPTSNNVMETQNVAFYSSSVMEGTCKAVVFETGDRTVIGRLATLTVGKLIFFLIKPGKKKRGKKSLDPE